MKRLTPRIFRKIEIVHVLERTLLLNSLQFESLIYYTIQVSASVCNHDKYLAMKSRNYFLRNVKIRNYPAKGEEEYCMVIAYIGRGECIGVVASRKSKRSWKKTVGRKRSFTNWETPVNDLSVNHFTSFKQLMIQFLFHYNIIISGEFVLPSPTVCQSYRRVFE